MFIVFVILPLSASQFCPDEYKCSSGTSTLPDIQSRIGNDTHVLDLSCQGTAILVSDYFSQQDVTNFTSVHLNDNCIEFVPPKVFETFVALRHLYLQNNQINDIHPSAIQSNVHLITLDLSRNKLQKFHPIIFQKSFSLSWVNITGNPLNASALEPNLFNLSLNTIDTDTCNNTENSINYFEAIPYLRELNLKENAMFTVENLTSYQNIEPKKMSLENYVFHNLLNLGYNNSSELRYDAIQKVIFGPSDTSLVCFCNRLSAWFWCFERPLQCSGHSADIYSLLNCNVTPTETPLLHTSSSSSAPALSTKPSAETSTTDDITDFATDTSTSNKYPEQETASYNINLYVAIGLGILGVIIICSVVITVVIIVVRSRRKKNAREQSVRYTSVSQGNSDPSTSITYCNPLDSRGYNAVSPIYETPYAHKEYTTFRQPLSIGTRVDHVRRRPAEYD
jgi:hypothetical protein